MQSLSNLHHPVRNVSDLFRIKITARCKGALALALKPSVTRRHLSLYNGIMSRGREDVVEHRKFLADV